jgi:hypothetical protein
MSPFLLFKNTLIIAWLSSLLVSTAGVSVHRVYCFCKNESSISVFSPPKDDCEKQTSESKNCCKSIPKKENCCEISTKNSAKKHDCSDRSTKFAKLDVKFITTDFLSQLIDYEVVAPVLLAFFCEINADCPRKISIAGNVSPPCRIAGRELLIFVENFRW